MRFLPHLHLDDGRMGMFTPSPFFDYQASPFVDQLLTGQNKLISGHECRWNGDYTYAHKGHSSRPESQLSAQKAG